MSNVKTKKQIQVEQQVLYTLSQIIEIAPQYTIAQHLTHFLRTKGKEKEVYGWSDELILKKVEEYYDELKSDLLLPVEEED
jgi:hypothetical protein